MDPSSVGFNLLMFKDVMEVYMAEISGRNFTSGVDLAKPPQAIKDDSSSR